MRALSTLFAGIVVALFLAGCFEDSASVSKSPTSPSRRAGAGVPLQIPEGWAELAVEGGGDHEHRLHAHHRDRSTPNFEVLAYDPLITDYFGATAGGHSCGDTVEKDGRRLTVVHSINNDIAFVIIDVTDPRRPQKIGELVMDNTQTYDVGISPDQRFAVLATTPLGLGPGNVAPPLISTATFRDACTGQTRSVQGPESSLPFSPGLVLVDIANPRNPTIVDFLLYPVLGGHSVRIAEIQHRVLVLTAVSSVPGYYALAELTQVAGRPKLMPLSTYTIGEQVAYWGTVPPSGHDGFLQKHPVTGANLAYLAYGTMGLVILNIDDPERPELVSQWDDWKAVGGPDPSHFFHGILPMSELWDGRHYTFAGEECLGRPPKTPTCLLYVFDTTNPETPTLVSAWTLPVDVEWREAAQFSTHYMDLINGTLFVAMYHAGLWALDVSTPEALRTLPSIGVFVPDRSSPKPPRTITYGAPAVLDVTPLSDGSMVVFDRGAGLYTVRFDAANPAPAPQPWPIPRLTG